MKAQKKIKVCKTWKDRNSKLVAVVHRDRGDSAETLDKQLQAGKMYERLFVFWE